MVWKGETQSWEVLDGLDPVMVQKNSGAVYVSHNASYELNCLRAKIKVYMRDRNIQGSPDAGERLVMGLGDLSRLSILQYLTKASDLPLSEELVRPSDLSGGDIFLRGTHILPLVSFAEYFSSNPDALLQAGERLGAVRCEYGDIALQLKPFARIPVVVILWLGDEEFPAAASLLFDASCTLHLSTDILWSTAMITLEMLLSEAGAFEHCEFIKLPD
ncbi:MAG: DUF3786 domain-containing protein [Nitrospira sp.]|nr:DUF3786 domain-containing protein [bacterium]MBL7049674.1 DUF3786 domain-containing protein [Nitrospira sp.]